MAWRCLKDEFVFFAESAEKMHPRRKKKHLQEHKTESPQDTLREHTEQVRLDVVHRRKEYLQCIVGGHGLQEAAGEHSISLFFAETKHRLLMIMESICKLGEDVAKSSSGWSLLGSKHSTTRRKHYEAVLWFLDRQLCKAVEESEAFEALVQHQEAPLAGDESEPEMGWDVVEGEELFERRFGAAVGEEALDQLEQESQLLFSDMQAVDTRLASTHQRIGEIAELQSVVQRHILAQELQLQRLHEEATDVVAEVESGNKHLSSSSKRVSVLSRIFAAFFFFLSLAILILHAVEK